MWKWQIRLLEKLGIFQKKPSKPEPLKYTCRNCVWWAAEEENNAPSAEKVSNQFAKYPDEYKFCDIHKAYTHRIHTCNFHIEEKFEPHEGSVTTEELSLDIESSIEKVKKEGS